MPAQFKLEMLRGPIRIDVANDQTFLSVETAETAVTSEGRASYGVAFDPQNGKTLVRAYQGTVKVRPWWDGAAPFDLASGQQVEVTDSGAGAVLPIAATNVVATTLAPATPAAAPTAPAAPAALVAGVPMWLAGSACLVLVVVLGGVLGVVLLGGKRRMAPRPVQPVPPGNWPPPQGVQPGGPPSVPFARLVVVQGSASFPWLDLPPAGVVVGRNQDCGLALADQAASRYHAQITCAYGTWFVTDMNSSNGTGVNGMRVTQQALKPGDQIQIGGTVLRFEQF